MNRPGFFMTLRLEKGMQFVHEDLYARQPDGSYSVLPKEIDVHVVPEPLNGPRKKTLMFEIEAMQFDGSRETAEAILEWFDDDASWDESWKEGAPGRLWVRVTDDNDDFMRPGEWLVRGYDSEWDYCLMSDEEFRDLGGGI